MANDGAGVSAEGEALDEACLAWAAQEWQGRLPHEEHVEASARLLAAAIRAGVGEAIRPTVREICGRMLQGAAAGIEEKYGKRILDVENAVARGAWFAERQASLEAIPARVRDCPAVLAGPHGDTYFGCAKPLAAHAKGPGLILHVDRSGREWATCAGFTVPAWASLPASEFTPCAHCHVQARNHLPPAPAAPETRPREAEGSGAPMVDGRLLSAEEEEWLALRADFSERQRWSVADWASSRRAGEPEWFPPRPFVGPHKAAATLLGLWSQLDEQGRDALTLHAGALSRGETWGPIDGLSNDQRRWLTLFSATSPAQLDALEKLPPGQLWWKLADVLGVAPAHSAIESPIDMVLHCPFCGIQHLDAPEPSSGWANPPHRSHLCHSCGVVWRPADVATNGVALLKTRGSGDTYLTAILVPPSARAALHAEQPPATTREGAPQIGDTPEEEREADEWVAGELGAPVSVARAVADFRGASMARRRALARWHRAFAAEIMALPSPEEIAAVRGVIAFLAWVFKIARAPIPCVQCGKPVEEQRRVYVSPTCCACLPAPRPIEVVSWPAPHERDPACPDHGVVTPDSFPGSDFESPAPPRCSCPRSAP